MKKLPAIIRIFSLIHHGFWMVHNAIRIMLYRHLFSAQIGKRNWLSNLQINWPQQLVLGNGLKLGRNVEIVVDGPSGYPGKVTIGDDVEIVGTVRIKKKDENNVLIGSGSFLGYGVEINVSSNLTIGRNVLVATGVKITDANHKYDPSFLPRINHTKTEPVKVEDDAWIGSNAIILPGVTIGKGSVVAAGSIVTRSIPPWELWAGVPAKFVRAIVENPQDQAE